MGTLTRFQRIKEVKRRVEDGQLLTDQFFDQLLSPKFRALSTRHWTPAEVALRAAALLVESASDHILDVGAGVGKVCVLGGLSTRAKFTGAELREPFLKQAEALAEMFDVERNVRFVAEDALTLDWNHFTGFYFYNPFYENISELSRMHPPLDFGMARFEHSVKTVQEKLRTVRPGTKVVIFHGFGGGVPFGFERTIKEPVGPDFLELWIKRN